MCAYGYMMVGRDYSRSLERGAGMWIQPPHLSFFSGLTGLPFPPTPSDLPHYPFILAHRLSTHPRTRLSPSLLYCFSTDSFCPVDWTLLKPEFSLVLLPLCFFPSYSQYASQHLVNIPPVFHITVSGTIIHSLCSGPNTRSHLCLCLFSLPLFSPLAKLIVSPLSTSQGCPLPSPPCLCTAQCYHFLVLPHKSLLPDLLFLLLSSAAYSPTAAE